MPTPINAAPEPPRLTLAERLYWRLDNWPAREAILALVASAIVGYLVGSIR